jgi:metallo-beta-lactamase family protein
MELEFYGAAGEVTGSCHILRVGRRAVLIDCGLIQGGKDAVRRNREPFPFNAQAIDAVLLTHAHLDHCGRLPLLVQRGFRGAIYTSAACRDLLPILLRDAADLSLREAERTNRRLQQGEPAAEPLFTLEEVEKTLKLVRAVHYDTAYEPVPGITLTLRDAGHIMGSASLELECREDTVKRKLVFSGDLGPYDSPILLDPHTFAEADMVIMESTYGDRRHRAREDTLIEMREIIALASLAQGNIVVPAFAIGRSQELLYMLGKHFADWNLGPWSIFLDSPMAIEASAVYWHHSDRHDEEAQHLRAGFTAMPALPNLKLCRTVEDSRRINDYISHAFIIAGSGMCNGGRVLHHLRRNLPRPECHVIIVGFQAPGTLGRALVEGQPQVRIYGESVSIRAEIHTVGGFSAHGDQADLLQWYESFSNRPAVYLVHGEPEPARTLQQKIRERGAEVVIVQRGMRVDLSRLRPQPGLQQTVAQPN